MCLICSPRSGAPGGRERKKGWNEVATESQRADNFPHICEKCNLSVTLMMSAGCCVQRGIGLKRLWRGQGKPFQMERRRGKRDTIATKGVRYGSLGLHTGSSLSQLLVSSWSNWINLRGDSGRPGGCAVGANVGQISWTHWGGVDPLLQCHLTTHWRWKLLSASSDSNAAIFCWHHITYHYHQYLIDYRSCCSAVFIGQIRVINMTLWDAANVSLTERKQEIRVSSCGLGAAFLHAQRSISKWFSSRGIYFHIVVHSLFNSAFVQWCTNSAWFTKNTGFPGQCIELFPPIVAI